MLRTSLIITAILAGGNIFATPLVNSSDDWRYFMGMVAPPANWQTIPDATLEASWLTGPGGIGIWVYRWRINGGDWSNDLPLVPQEILDGAPLTPTLFNSFPPIELTHLTDGTDSVEVLGQNSAGDWQESPTVSKTWTVQSSFQGTNMDGVQDDYENANGFDFENTEDTDGDGPSNLGEYIAGTLSCDPTSLLARNASLPGNNVALSFEAIDGKSYQIQNSTTPEPDSWSVLETVLEASGGLQNYTHSNGANSPKKFYRLVTPTP